MDFFLHSAKARYSQKLLNLQHDYGLGGIGFYWRAVELIMSENCKLPISSFLGLRYSPIRADDVEPIIRGYGLFVVDKNEMVSLKMDKQNGIGEESVKLLISLIRSGVCADIGAEACAETGAETRVETGAKIGAEAGAEAYTPPGPTEIDIEKIRLKKIRARDKFDKFMKLRCPNLCEMEDPLTMDEFRELKLDYTWQQIQEVLLAMENEKGLGSKRRSCYRTALSWLKTRFGVPEGGLRQKGVVKERVFDEYGKPVYYQLNNNDNEQQDSNSTDGSADAEQQGDGGSCTQQPDE